MFDIPKSCSDLKLMLQQQSVVGGFIPLTNLQGKEIKNCNYVMKDIELCQDPVRLFEYVNSYGVLNLIGARVQVNYTLNLDLFDVLLKDYWDWQVALFLRFGFPMNFQGQCSDLHDINAHKSAELFQSHVDMYLQD